MATIDSDDSIGAIVLTGSEKAFAAGADIKEMKDKEFAQVYKTQFLGHWTKMNSVRKPIIGAVSGYAVGRRGPVTSRNYANDPCRVAGRWMRACYDVGQMQSQPGAD